MKKKIALFLVFVLITTLFAACGGEIEDAPNVLKWDIGPEPYSLDPQLNFSNDGGNIINNTFEGLMRESNGELVPGMAESYEITQEGTVYTFYLKDAQWSDGNPVTANDFEYAWKRACDPNLEPEPARYSYQLFYIKGAQEAIEGKGSPDDVAVTALDEKTLKVELLSPTPYFLDLTTFYTYMPVRADMIEKDTDGWARNPETAVSNGPFVLTEYKAGESLTLSKNQNYWDSDNVNLDYIEGFFIVEENTMLSAYEAGEVDVIPDVPIQEIPRLKENNSDFYILPSIGTNYYIFNTQKEPMDDPLVRKALSYVINRTAIVEKITQGEEAEATGFVPIGLLDEEGNDFREIAGDYGIDKATGNVERAKELLAEAGYPNGEGFPTLELIFNSYGSHQAVAEAIQQMWKKELGIDIRILNQEWGALQDNIYSGNFEIASGGWTADYADPTTMLDIWLSYSGNNTAKWDSKRYDALIEESKTITGQERFDCLYEAEALLMDAMIVAPILYYTDTVMVKDYVKDWQKTKLGLWYFGQTQIVNE